MSTFRYNVIVDVGINTGGIAQGQRQAAASLGAVNAQVNQLGQNFNKATREAGLFASAFKGAFIGALTGFAVRATLGNLLDITTAIKDAGIAAIKSAGDFQMTVNAMTLFTGSVSSARAELKALSDLAREVPGLRLEEAQEGATRLRALGFEAKVASDIVAGIAKQRLVSGVTDTAATNRVIVNLQQLRAGSPQIQRDIQQMILSIPSLSIEIDKAFGSIEKFKTALRRDPNAAIEKFAETLRNAEAPALGFNENLGILIDTYTEASRAFGEPILEPLVAVMKELTQFIHENRAAWTLWGQSVGDTIRGAQAFFNEGGGLDTLARIVSPTGGASGLRLAANVAYLGTPIGALTQSGRRSREVEEGVNYLGARGREADVRRRLGLSSDFIGPVSESMIGERDAELRRQKNAARQEAEIQRREDLENLQLHARGAEVILKNRYAQEQALLNSHLRHTTEQELEYIKDSGVLKQEHLKADLSRITAYYDKAIALQDEGSQEQKKLIAERDAALSDANTAIYNNELETQLKIKEQEFRIYEERRQALIDFKDLQIRQIEQANSIIAARLEQEIDLYGTGYEDLIYQTENAYLEIARLTNESFDLRLQDASLTKEKTTELYEEMYYQLERLAEGNAQKVSAIEQRRLQEQARRVREALQYQQSLNTGRQGGFSSVLGILSPGIDFGSGFPALGASEAVGMSATSQIERNIKAVLEGRMSFYEAQAGIQQELHQKQLENIDLEIKANKELLQIERVRAIGIQQGLIGSLERERIALERLKSAAAGTPEEEAYTNQIADNVERTARASETIARLKAGGVTGTVEGGRLEQANRLLELQRGVLELDQNIERSNLKQALDLKTINEVTQQILQGKKDSLLNAINELNVTTELQAASVEYREQEVLLGNNALLNLARQAEVLREITAIRNEELQAVFAIDRAQLRIAQQYQYSQNRADAAVLNFLASQKGITEIVSDTKINLLTTAYSGLEAVADRLTRKFGAFRDVIRDLIANLLKLAVNRLFGGFATGGGGGASRGGGGIFQSIFGGGGGGGLSGIFGSGGGFGGTPAYGGGSGLPIGAFGTSVEGDLATIFGPSAGGAGGLLRPGAAQGSSIGGLLGGGGVSLGGLASVGGGFLAGLPLFGGGLGAAVGGSSISGQILGGLGGVLGGVAALGGLLTAFAGTGVAAGAAGILGVGLTGGILAAAPFAAVAAPLLILGAFFLARDKARKRDEKIRNQLMIDSLRGLDNLIDGVKNDRIDGNSALEQAEQIRKQYLEQAGALKDKKTRGIALKDVARVDAKIQELKAVVNDQARRRERLEQIVPTFAWGGPASGYQRGAGHGTQDNMPVYFPVAGRSGYVSPTEYILDAQTTSNIGVNNLDVMRATKGASFNQMRKSMTKFASGGGFASGVGVTSSGGDGGGTTTLEVNMNVGIAESQFAEVVAAYIKRANGSREQIQAIVKSLENAGKGDPALAKLANLLKGSM